MPGFKSSLLIEAPPDVSRRAAPYASSDEHLQDELCRIDLLIRAQTVRWRMTIAASKPEQLWGMVHVTEAEVEAYLQTEFMPPGAVPAPLVAAHKEYWNEAESLRHIIRGRVEKTSAGGARRRGGRAARGGRAGRGGDRI